MLAYLALLVPVARDRALRTGSVNAPRRLEPQSSEAPSTTSRLPEVPACADGPGC